MRDVGLYHVYHVLTLTDQMVVSTALGAQDTEIIPQSSCDNICRKIFVPKMLPKLRQWWSSVSGVVLLGHQ